MFVGRRSNGAIYGVWTVPQPDDEFHTGIEELDEDHADVVTFTQRTLPASVDPRDTKLDDLQARLEILESKSVKEGTP